MTAIRINAMFDLKMRGRVGTAWFTGTVPVVGSFLRRVSDGQEFCVMGVERFVVFLGRPEAKDEHMGFLLVSPYGGQMQVGDEFEAVSEVKEASQATGAR